jgi:hypothetical protein
MPDFLFLLFGLFLFFSGIGFMITEKNANYMLAGYNRLTQEEKDAFNLSEFIRKHKKFHLIFSFTYLIVGLSIYYLYGVTEASYWLVTSPLIAYAYYIPVKKSPFLMEKSRPYFRKAVSLILLGLAFYFSFLFFECLQDNKMDIVSNEIQISGIYGTSIPVGDINKVEIIPAPPVMVKKLHGITTKKLMKGFFRLDNGSEVLMYINRIGEQCIRIERKNANPVYYNSSELDETAVIAKIKAAATAIQ